MKKHKILSIASLLILTIFFSNKAFATGYFDTYSGNIPWNEEKVHLANLAIELKYEAEMIGYIVFRIGTKDNRKKINSRINRIRKHLFSKYGVNSKRIVFVISDTPSPTENTFIILQPIPKSIPQPDF